MLRGYATDPEAFTSTVPEREPLPLEWWESRVSDHPDAPEMVFGAFVESRLVGVAGLKFERRPRTKHKVILFGIYVLEEARGQGIARALIEAALEKAQASSDIRVVQLTVSQSNGSAMRLYEACGFQPFGTEPLALKYGERYVSLVHMWRAAGPEAT